jgi:BirA family biotin operon repressor/biotin-[acetyl-CoA-carboxylase] ligase
VLRPNPLLSLAAGVAAAEACGADVRLKWPNDLMLKGGKLGGVLVEATPTKAICGIGINLSWAPAGGSKLNQPRQPLLQKLRQTIGTWSSAPPDDVLAAWRRLSDTLGRRVRVELPGRAIEGRADDVGPRGELIVDGVPFSSGSIIHLSG